MNNKFLDKVYEQIISETIVKGGKIYFPYLLYPSPHHALPLYLTPFIFSIPLLFLSHCKEIYSLNKEETEYVWTKYKEELTTLIHKKELTYE